MSDQIVEYQVCLATLKEEGILLNGLYPGLQQIKDKLVPELESENNIAYGAKPSDQIPDETLKEYIRISRDIRDFIFRTIDHHVLTIERLSDQILCKRRAWERRTKDTTRPAVQATAKAVVEKAMPVSKDSTTDVLQQLANLNATDLARVLAGLEKK